MKTALLDYEARGRYMKEINEGRPADAGYATHEHRYKAVLGQLQGKRLPVVEVVQGGIQHYENVLPDFDITDHNGKPISAKVIAVPGCYLSDEQEDDQVLDIPVEEPTGQVKMAIIRLLTPWVDGFQAFKRPLHYQELGEQTTCPYCGHDELYHSWWQGTRQHFHVCESCRERFITGATDQDPDTRK